MGREIRKVVVLGANGAMGSGSGAVFAGAGIETVFLARDLRESPRRAGPRRGHGQVGGDRQRIKLGTYEHDLESSCTDADLVFEALAEDLTLKQEFFEKVDRAPQAGLDRRHGVLGPVDRRHGGGAQRELPPELPRHAPLQSAERDRRLRGDSASPAPTKASRGSSTELLEHRSAAKVVETADLPAFAGNRVGFKVLNEVAQLAGEHGVAFMDTLVGPHTGRAMAPLATVDLVGWDVHRAIVDNVLRQHQGRGARGVRAAGLHGER